MSQFSPRLEQKVVLESHKVPLVKHPTSVKELNISDQEICNLFVNIARLTKLDLNRGITGVISCKTGFS